MAVMVTVDGYGWRGAFRVGLQSGRFDARNFGACFYFKLQVYSSIIDDSRQHNDFGAIMRFYVRISACRRGRSAGQDPSRAAFPALGSGNMLKNEKCAGLPAPERARPADAFLD
jgi:hypothetical protein